MASNISNLSFWIVLSLLVSFVGAEDQDGCAVSLLQSKAQVPTQSVPITEKVAGVCLNVTSWHEILSKQKPWRKYSQGNQDSILASLFHESHLGTANQYFVEFGFHDIESSPTPNTRLLAEQGWTGLRMDGDVENSTVARRENLHQEFVTSENVASLFDKYDVPREADYVSIDIDSCDMWVFLGLTEKYRPRALTVEYNSKYPLGESKTNACKDSAGQLYSWHGDDMYGASLTALHKAAVQMGYTVVAVEFKMDVFLVRKDLVCPGTELPIEFFGNYAGWPFPQYRQGNVTEMKRWVVDY